MDLSYKADMLPALSKASVGICSHLSGFALHFPYAFTSNYKLIIKIYALFYLKCKTLHSLNDLATDHVPYF